MSSAATSRRLTATWCASWAVPAVLQFVLSMWIATDETAGSAHLLFWIVVVAASLCVVAATAVMRRAFRTGEADLGAVGLFFFPVSALPLVHGITTPGVLVEGNTSTMTSVLLSIPVALIVTAPFALPARVQSQWIRKHWRGWIVGSTAATTALAVALLIDTDLLPAPTPRRGITVTIALASLAGCTLYSRRHLRLARVAERPAPLVVGAGYGFVGASALVWLSATPFSAGFWSAHVLDIFGVLVATIGALVVYRRTRDVNRVLRPALAVDPTTALAVGLDPLVHRFVADLEAKDQITRDHVVRTAELAIDVACELRLPPDAVRRVGLTAILHDVGKLNVPDAVLNKPGRLDDDEFAVIQRHTVHGWELVAASPTLIEVAAGVRGHHERIDGAGYPDKLAGDAIPLEARVVAACDAFDAMANTRQYREGMGVDKAVAVLQEHAGSQWDPVVVAAVVAVARRGRPSQPSVLDEVGRTGETGATPRTGCDCLPEALLRA